MPPDNSQNLLLEEGDLRFSLIASRAASTHSVGTPESGTGTAIHSSRGFSVDERRFLYCLPFGPVSDT
jgi:hypothetical protein